MAVEEGKFKLYAKIAPPLEAGDWRFQATQSLSADLENVSNETSDLNENDLKVDAENIHVRIRSPRYVMPPDQILSTYPPANSQGSYGSRLPQVVIKRRTLPWERRLDGAPDSTPWLALVLIAEGEAQFDTAVDVAECVTPGVVLDGVTDVAKGNRLVVRKSVIDKVFPTRNDIDLLAHAREVDINDTELMMGDDDGFLSVVISNRLPVPGKDEQGNDVPIKYLACLVNLEGQYEALLERSPDPDPIYFTSLFLHHYEYVDQAAEDDHRTMGTATTTARNGVEPAPLDLDTGAASPRAASAAGSNAYQVMSGAATGGGATPHGVNSQWSTTEHTHQVAADISMQMAVPFRHAHDYGLVLDQEFRFPVLLHWSFTTTGDTTFRSLMENLDSRLLGDVGEASSKLDGRLPLEVVESGHVGLNHKTREGDETRSWYRGPLVPHPTLSDPTKRLDLAHSSDQLRIVIPDGREDLSLATAFEIGRLLTLSQPSIIASLMRWRQDHYQAARLQSFFQANPELWQELLGPELNFVDAHKLGPMLGRKLVEAIANQPETFLGDPRPQITPGRPVEVEGLGLDVLGKGLGLDTDVLRGDISSILSKLREIEVPREILSKKELGTVGMRKFFETNLDNQRLDLVSNTLSNKLIDDALTGPAFPVTEKIRLDTNFDVLDRLLVAPNPARPADEEDQ